MADDGSSKAGKAQPVIKKVTAYPFDGTLEAASVKKAVEVLKLKPEALLVNLTKNLVNVGEHYQLHFTLPISNHSVTAHVIVMKTYDRSINPKEKLVERVAELRFISLPDNHRASIVAFLNAIGQSA